MTDHTGCPVPTGLADLPLAERRRIEAQKQRELDEALTRRHVAEAEYGRRYEAVHLDRLLRDGPALAAKLRRE